MVRVKEDLTGKQFGRLTVLQQAEDYVGPNGRHSARWLCECSCKEHNKVVVNSSNLKRGVTTSCGCFAKEQSGKRFKEIVSELNKKNKTKVNNYDLSGEYGIGCTFNTNQEFYFDLEDYDKIKGYCWSEHIYKNGYRTLDARDKSTGKVVRMQWVIAGKYYDHINRNTLDNRKHNLRLVSQQKNAQNSSMQSNNTSGFIGVCWCSSKQKWNAYIRVNNKQKHCGYFNSKYDAIVSRLKAELKYYGAEFAPQRHLFKEYGILDTEEVTCDYSM